MTATGEPPEKYMDLIAELKLTDVDVVAEAEAEAGALKELHLHV